MVVPPPARLSMTKVWPVCCCTCSYKARGTRSVALPGANGTMIRTVLVGQPCAHAGPDDAITPASAKPAMTIAALHACCFVTLLFIRSFPCRSDRHAPAREPLGQSDKV